MATRSRKSIFEQVRKKLDALRVTLSDDERAIFDSLVRTDEVEAHKLKPTRSRAKPTNQRSKTLSEVEAHKLKPTRSRAKPTNQRSKTLSEVEAHKMKPT